MNVEVLPDTRYSEISFIAQRQSQIFQLPTSLAFSSSRAAQSGGKFLLKTEGTARRKDEQRVSIYLEGLGSQKGTLVFHTFHIAHGLLAKNR
jgi:hypothetical protein